MSGSTIIQSRSAADLGNRNLFAETEIEAPAKRQRSRHPLLKLLVLLLTTDRQSLGIRKFDLSLKSQHYQVDNLKS